MEIDESAAAAATPAAGADVTSSGDPVDCSSLLQEFSRMGTNDRDVLIQRMQQLAEGLTATESAFFLDMNNWNLEAALWAYFEFNQNMQQHQQQSTATVTHQATLHSFPNSQQLDMDSGSSSSGRGGNGSDQQQWAIQPALTMDFVADRTVGDGEAVTPDTPFVKTWCLRNSGPQPWPAGSVFRHVSGDPISGQPVRLDSPVAVNQEVSLTVRFRSPATPGTYTSQWQLHTEQGAPIGGVIPVDIRVDVAGLMAVTQQLDAVHCLSRDPVQ